jgi:hypothetical protein
LVQSKSKLCLFGSDGKKRIRHPFYLKFAAKNQTSSERDQIINSMAHKNLLENRTFNIYREIVRGSDLGMERTRRGRGSTRKIFEWGQNGRKGRVQDTNGMLERMKKKHGEEGERETGMPVKKWKD